MFQRLLLRRALPAAFATFVFGLGGCSASKAPSLGRAREAIIGGELSQHGIEDAVLLLRTVTAENGERLCSASLVAENLAVTARHCAATVGDGRFLCSPSGERTEIDADAGRMGLDLPPETLEFYSNDTPRSEPVALGERIVSTLSDSACRDDLAFVVLDRAVELPILPLRRGRPGLEGEAVVAVGYGMTQGNAPAIDYETQKRRRKAGLSISSVGPDSRDVVGMAPARVVIVDGPGACLGDSGGPLLAESTNALLAVHSLVEGDCVSPESRSWYAHLPPLWPWAERAFDAAGATPTLEPDPSGDPCTEGGCAGQGAGGAAAGGAGGNDSSGAGGAPPKPPDPEPDAGTRTKPTERRDSGCAIGDARRRGSSTASAAALSLAALLRRMRRRARAQRRPSSGSEPGGFAFGDASVGAATGPAA